ncbi:hypothetical protein CS542_01265 [Pedobacter sp. IW39]|nr:hypothetical protein CS542_01265 [Pedobacter sp. IW39]
MIMLTAQFRNPELSLSTCPVINFYNVIHTALTRPETGLIIPANPQEPPITNQELLQNISNYRYLLAACAAGDSVYWLSL